MRDSVLGLRDHDLSRRQSLTQAPLRVDFTGVGPKATESTPGWPLSQD